MRPGKAVAVRQSTSCADCAENASASRAPMTPRTASRRPLARRLAREVHDGVEPRERVELAPPLRRVAESAASSRRRAGSGVKSSCSSSGTTFSPITRLARITESDAHQPAQESAPPSGDPIGRDRRHLRQRQLERHRAGGCERRARCAKRRVFLGRRRPRCAGAPASRRSPRATSAGDVRQRRQHQLERPGLRGGLRDRRAEGRGEAADFAAPASRQHQHQRRIGEPPPRLLGVRPQVARSARPADGPHRCSAARRAARTRPARTAGSPAPRPRSGASRAPATAARPRPRAAHS